MVTLVGGTAWIAGVATAACTLSHPLTNRITTSVITQDLIDRVDGSAAGRVTDHTAGTVIATPVCFRICRQRKTNRGEGSENSECSFHDGV